MSRASLIRYLVTAVVCGHRLLTPEDASTLTAAAVKVKSLLRVQQTHSGAYSVALGKIFLSTGASRDLFCDFLFIFDIFF